MAARNHIRNPLEWTWDQIRTAGQGLSASARSLGGDDADVAPKVRTITRGDLRLALSRGWQDFAAFRTDVIFLCLIYPLIGLLLARVAFGRDMIPLIFPLISGFALLGPVAAAGLYEMSRLREAGAEVSWASAFGLVFTPSLGPLIILGIALGVLFALWLVAADAIYAATLGPLPPPSLGAFVEAAVSTAAGWTMIVVGCAVGFLFALLVLAISVVSFPMLIDREVGLGTAIGTSVRAVTANPGPMLLWGLIVAGALVIGALPALIGLIIVVPVLGHATWHLYRRLVAF